MPKLPELAKSFISVRALVFIHKPLASQIWSSPLGFAPPNILKVEYLLVSKASNTSIIAAPKSAVGLLGLGNIEVAVAMEV